MLLKFKNFEIQDDRGCFILTVFGEKKNKETGEMSFGQIDQIYPSSLIGCFESMKSRKKWLDKSEYDNIDNYIEKIKQIETEIRDEFISQIKNNI